MPGHSGNQYATAYSIFVTDSDFEGALKQAVAKITAQLSDPDLVFAFVSGVSSAAFDSQMPALKGLLSAKHVAGVSCEAAIVDELELEGEASIVLWAAKFCDRVSILPMRLVYERSADGGAFTGWPDEALGQWPDDSLLLSLSEPFSFPIDGLIERMNEDRPGVPMSGGVCSGPFAPGDNRILLNEEVFDSGGILFRIAGLRYQTIVSQGCRPIGSPFVVTKSFGSELIELGGEPAFKKLHDLFQTLPTRDQRLMQNGLHLGIVMNEQQADFNVGDFLIRNVIGVNEAEKSITIGDFVRIGQTVQFHIRDEASATQELSQMLSESQQEPSDGAEQAVAGGALLFSCNGRGSRLFSEPNHDAGQFQKTLGGKLSLAGFFAAGEIGRVGKKNFLHGFTASGILFE